MWWSIEFERCCKKVCFFRIFVYVYLSPLSCTTKVMKMGFCWCYSWMITESVTLTFRSILTVSVYNCFFNFFFRKYHLYRFTLFQLVEGAIERTNGQKIIYTILRLQNTKCGLINGKMQTRNAKHYVFTNKMKNRLVTRPKKNRKRNANQKQNREKKQNKNKSSFSLWLCRTVNRLKIIRQL